MYVDQQRHTSKLVDSLSAYDFNLFADNLYSAIPLEDFKINLRRRNESWENTLQLLSINQSNN